MKTQTKCPASKRRTFRGSLRWLFIAAFFSLAASINAQTTNAELQSQFAGPGVKTQLTKPELAVAKKDDQLKLPSAINPVPNAVTATTYPSPVTLTWLLKTCQPVPPS